MEKNLKNDIKNLYEYGLEKHQEMQKIKEDLDKIRHNRKRLMEERDKVPEPFKPNFDSGIVEYDNQISELENQLQNSKKQFSEEISKRKMEILSKLRARQSIIAKYAQMTDSNYRIKKIKELEERKKIVEKYLKITDKKEKENIINDLKERQAIIKQYENRTPEQKQTRISNAEIEINSAEEYLKECEDLENANIKSLIKGMNKKEANDKINSIINKTSEKKNKIESIKKNKRLIEVLSLKEPMKEYDYMNKCIDVLGIDDLDMEKQRIEEEIEILSLENNLKEYQNIDNIINRLKVTTLENIQNWDLNEFGLDKEQEEPDLNLNDFGSDEEQKVPDLNLDDFGSGEEQEEPDILTQEENIEESIVENDDEELQIIFDDKTKNRYWELLQKLESGAILSDEEMQEYEELNDKRFNETNDDEYYDVIQFIEQKRKENIKTFTQEQIEPDLNLNDLGSGEEQEVPDLNLDDFDSGEEQEEPDILTQEENIEESIVENDDEELQIIFDDKTKNRYWELLQKLESSAILSDEEMQEYQELEDKLFNETNDEEYDDVIQFIEQKRKENTKTFTQEQMEKLWQLQQNIHNLSDEDKKEYDDLCKQVEKLNDQKKREVFNYIQSEQDKIDEENKKNLEQKRKEKYEKNKRLVNKDNFNMIVGKNITISHSDEFGDKQGIIIKASDVKSILSNKQLISNIKQNAYNLLGDEVPRGVFDDNDCIFLFGVLKAQNHNIVDIDGEIIKGLDQDIAKRIIVTFINAKHNKDPYSQDLIKDVFSFDLKGIEGKGKYSKIEEVANEYEKDNMTTIVQNKKSKVKEFINKVGSAFMSRIKKKKEPQQLGDGQDNTERTSFVPKVDTPVPSSKLTPEEEVHSIKIQRDDGSRS